MKKIMLKKVQCISPAGLHSITYKEWGHPNNPHILVCVHGITRVSDDFDFLASVLCEKLRVICPDMVGRGRSEYLKNPMYYTISQYVSDIITLLAKVHARTIDWLGTSMGGLIGMQLCSLKNNPIRRLILNDIGILTDRKILLAISNYIEQNICFDSFNDAASYIRAISINFGEHTESQWKKLAHDVLYQDKNGKWKQHYDPNLAVPLKTMALKKTQPSLKVLWKTYDAICCPTLLIRGKNSNVLLPDTAHEMTKRGPHATLIEFDNIGHAPTFLHINQVKTVKQFLFN